MAIRKVTNLPPQRNDGSDFASAYTSAFNAAANKAANEMTDAREREKIRLLVNKARMDELSSGFTSGPEGVNFDPDFTTKDSPSWQNAQRRAELKAQSSGQKGATDVLTLDQLVAAEKARESGVVPENMRDVRISPSYNFRSTAKPQAGLSARVLRSQGYQIDASIPDDYVVPTGALQYVNPQVAPPAQKAADREQRGTLAGESRALQERLQRERIAAAERLAAEKRAADAAKPGAKLSPAQKKVDEVFGKEYADYYASGGRAAVNRDIEEIGQLPEQLEKTGGLMEKLTRPLPKAVRDFAVPEVTKIQDRFELAAQKSLKRILGGQFAEKEAKEFFARTFNPRMSPEENANRIRSSLAEIKAMADDKDNAARFYEQNGTLAGFVPAAKNPSDFRAAGRANNSPQTKVIGGKKYQKFPQGWKEVK